MGFKRRKIVIRGTNKTSPRVFACYLYGGVELALAKSRI